jgi:hypothetical protein
MTGTALTVQPDLATAAGQAQHYASIHERLMRPALSPAPERPRRFIAVNRQSHGPDVAPPPMVALPLVRPDESILAKVRDFIVLTDDIDIDGPEQTITWQQIIATVCAKHFVSRAELLGRQRSRRIVAARHEAMYRMSTETTLSLPAIGRRLGGKDHTTVFYGVKMHRQRVGTSL